MEVSPMAEATPSTSSTPVPPAPPPRSGAGRALQLVFGSLAVLLAAGLIAGGVVLVWAMDTKRDGEGYFTTGSHRFQTASYGIASQTVDINADVPSWLFSDNFARVRVSASSNDASKPLFVGIARAEDVDRYLARVAHDEIADLNSDPFSVDYRRVNGTVAPARPGDQTFWRVRSSGPGRRTITWPTESGRWSVVVMNADGTRPVSAEARLGARVPALRWVALGVFIAGGVLLVGGGVLLWFGTRRRPAPDAVSAART
jgi:hypothetical protein